MGARSTSIEAPFTPRSLAHARDDTRTAHSFALFFPAMEAHPNVLVDNDQTTWSIEDAAALYMIDRWGAGYFGVNGNGDLAVAPLQDRGTTIPIIDVVREARAQNLQTPLLVRFQDLVRHRVETLNNAFNRAISDLNYHAAYRGVFPIKVNQLREVVEEILDAGKPYNYGIEVGSKPEIFAA